MSAVEIRDYVAKELIPADATMPAKKRKAQQTEESVMQREGAIYSPAGRV